MMVVKKGRTTASWRLHDSNQCIGECKGGCNGGIVADLVLHLKYDNGTLREAEELPLCLAHACNESFLSWYTKLAHKIVLGTARAMDTESADKMRFVYWVAARQPRKYFLELRSERRREPGLGVFGTTFSGTLGKSIIASSWRGRPYIRTYAVPSDPKTEPQQRHRALFTRAVAAWHRLEDCQRDFYNRLAARKQMTGFNIFVSRYVRALIEGKEPELPQLFRWTTSDGQPVLYAELLVLRESQLLFTESLETGSVQVALTQSDAPYMFLLRKGTEEKMAVGARDLVETCIPAVLESAALGIRLVANVQTPLGEAGRGTA